MKERQWLAPLRISLPVFLFLAIAGSTVITLSTRPDSRANQFEAQAVATSASRIIDDFLNRILLPVYSLAQFVPEVESFHNLSSQLKEQPYVKQYYRNVTGICNDPAQLDRFNRIASTIKRNSNLDQVLVNLQIVPNGIICMAYPLNNTQDFEGTFLDSSPVIGYDILQDPERRDTLKTTILEGKTIIAGPVVLRQCGDCDPTVEKALVVRVPIYVEGQTTTYNGQELPVWGAAAALVNWGALSESSQLLKAFQQFGMEYRLSKQSSIEPNGGVLGDTEISWNEEEVLTESEHFDPSKLSVSSLLDVADWVITVNVEEDSRPSWFVWSLVVWCGLSAAVSALLYAYLLQKELHQQELDEQTALRLELARKAAQSEKDLNEFIAHEVRNPLSAAIAANTFLKASFQEMKPLIQDTKHATTCGEDIKIVDSSLHFINELLRSLLDGDRITWDEMNLSEIHVDIRQDILEPVSNMIYKRDKNFEIQIECPENLIVKVDKLRLQQVILNLARNSSKFVEEGYLRLRAEVVNGSIAISVEDSGPGIPEAQRTDLFQRYQNSLHVDSQGTGVGLNLSKSLVNLMKGSIIHDTSFRSGFEDNIGTRIVVDLNQPPIEEGDALSLFQSSSTPPRKVSMSQSTDTTESLALPEELSVLFVDDDRILRKLASRSISKLMPKWRIREATSGETCLKLAKEEGRFDLIFVDMYMVSTEESLTGTDTVRFLRAHGCRSYICGLSANNMGKPFLDAGADYFLLKPFPADDLKLREALHDILNARDADIV